jgi:WD40 repeat protein
LEIRCYGSPSGAWDAWAPGRLEDSHLGSSGWMEYNWRSLVPFPFSLFFTSTSLYLVNTTEFQPVIDPYHPTLQPLAIDARGHSGFVNSEIFSPRRKFAAFALDDRTVRLLDLTKGASLSLTFTRPLWPMNNNEQSHPTTEKGSEETIQK